MPHLAASTLALLVVRLRRPRPRRLARQPGLIACAVATAAMLAVGVRVAALAARGMSIDWFEETNRRDVGTTAWMLAGTWPSLCLTYAASVGIVVAQAIAGSNEHR